MKPARAMAAMRSGVSYRSSLLVRPAPSEIAVASSVSSATSRSVRPEEAAVRNSSTILRAAHGVWRDVLLLERRSSVAG